MNKVINSRCICKEPLAAKDKRVEMMIPCEHMIHINCYTNTNHCPFCNKRINNRLTFNMVKKEIASGNKQYLQKYIDMLTVHNVSVNQEVNMINIIKKSYNAMSYFTQFMNIKNEYDVRMLCKNVFNTIPVKIYIKNSELITSDKKVYICNHKSYLDAVFIYYVLNCGFLASSDITKMWFCKNLVNIMPLLMVDRGKSHNMVNKMKEYIKDNRSLCLFPEGMINNVKTLMKFRTGAFYTGFPVQPLIIEYKPVIHDDDPNTFLMKLLSVNELNVYITMMEINNQPFDNDKIEIVRNKMAKTGKLLLSRVSNRDIVDQ